MPRPRADQDQRVEAYRMWKLGVGPAKIHRELKVYVEAEHYAADADVVVLRTVKNWLREFRTLDAKLDDSFEWHRIDEYRLPWEAGEYLLKMSCYMQEFFELLLRRFQINPTQERPIFRPTVRQARWWWRVHQAVPDEKAIFTDVYTWAEEYVRYELYKDVLGRDVDVSGLDAFLAYRARFGPEFREQYDSAVSDGRIPGLPSPGDQGPMIEALRQGGNTVSQNRGNLSSSGGSHSYIEGSIPIPQNMQVLLKQSPGKDSKEDQS